MKLINFFLLLILLSLHASAQNNGLTKYEINTEGSSVANRLMTYNNTLYFTAYDSNGYNLWSMDGVGNPKKEILFSPYGLNDITAITGAGDSIYLLVAGSMDTSGIYSYHTINKTLTPLKIHNNDNNIRFLLLNNQQIFYTTRGVVYKYDIPTSRADTFAYASAYNMAYVNNIYYAVVNESGKNLVYTIDVASKSLGTNLVPNSNNSLSLIASLNVIGNDLYFATSTPTHGCELYKHSGTKPAQRLTDIWPGAANGLSPYINWSQIVAYNSRLYFFGSDSINNASLFSYDTATGTTKLVYKNPYPPYYFQPKDLFVYKKRLYMSALDSVSLHQFFVYDEIDTPKLIATIQPPIVINRFIAEAPKYFTVLGADLYFSANDSVNNIELFRYNDSLLPALPIPPQALASIPTFFTITLYPNPTTKDAYLDVKLKEAQTMEVQLADIQGKVVYTHRSQLYSAGSHTIPLPVQQLPHGTYIYRIADENGMLLQSGKLLKQ